ncbi:MAG: FecR domain-containing protein [Sedimenticolaceae bacterium]
MLLLSLLSLPALAADWIYTVVDGDNLWDLSARYLDSQLRFEQVRKLNNVEFPKRMQPGTRLRIPMKWIRSNPVPANIAATRGQVELTRADGAQETAVAPGLIIRLGDVLKTGEDSSATVIFADGTKLTLRSASEMRFDHLSAHGKTGMVDSRLHLIDGRMDTRVKPAVGPGSRFEIQTPSAISAVRGTEYRAAVTADGHASNIEVLRGKVKVTGARKSRLVNAGFGTQVAQGQPPTPPRKLLPAPILNPVPERIRQLHWPLSWQAINQAHAYRVQISTDATFDTLLWEQIVNNARAALPDLPDGNYQVRVRGIDKGGLEGKNSAHPVLIDTHPQPPLPLQPREGKTLRGVSAELQWSASADAHRYQLEIAADEAFEQIVLSQGDLNTTRYEAAGVVEPGTYYWRVASVAADGEVGPAGAIRFWHLKPMPEKVQPAIEPEEDRLVASWPQASPEQTYHVQLAFDPSFSNLELDEFTPKPSISFPKSSTEVRYLRVRSIEPDGYQGPWGIVQRIDRPPDAGAWIIPLIGVLGLLLL